MDMNMDKQQQPQVQCHQTGSKTSTGVAHMSEQQSPTRGPNRLPTLPGPEAGRGILGCGIILLLYMPKSSDAIGVTQCIRSLTYRISCVPGPACCQTLKTLRAIPGGCTLRTRQPAG
jgi:hypothetical protein